MRYIVPSEREERNRTELLEKVRHLFFVEGFSKLSMETIAAKVGASKATLYKYFPNKDALVAATVDLQMGDIAENLERALGQGGSFAGRFAAFFSVIFGIIQPSVRAFINDVMTNAPREWLRIEAFRRERVFPRLEALIAEGMELGFMRRDLRPETLTPLIVAIIDQVARPSLILELPLTLEETMNTLIRILMQGILSDSGRRLLEQSGPSIRGADQQAEPKDR